MKIVENFYWTEHVIVRSVRTNGKTAYYMTSSIPVKAKKPVDDLIQLINFISDDDVTWWQIAQHEYELLADGFVVAHLFYQRYY